MMVYKVQREAFVSYQPKWLFRFLLSLSPKVYEARETLEEAQAIIRHIADAIADGNLQGTVSRLRVLSDDNHIILISPKDRPYLKFYIQEYYR